VETSVIVGCIVMEKGSEERFVTTVDRACKPVDQIPAFGLIQHRL
jgi:hypothetical protein